MPNPILEEQLQRRKTAEDKLREVQRFYANAARQREFLNPRNRFDSAEFREVIVDKGGICNGFIECKFVANKLEAILNFGFLPKYKSKDSILHLFTMILNTKEFKRVNHFYTFIHIGDTLLEHALDQVGFRRVADRPTLTKLRAILDGFHLTYLFERKNTVANRPAMTTRVMPRTQPLRTGDEQQEGKFDGLLRLKQLKEKRK